ncbi:hypothetical protein [Cryobacterium psychrophilum]|uniref:TOBE domain-containing protein n=1 Tax=Cryobacterium psychrophilum TaxID=41988 RepID=A0A4Y8KS41_9MICO|nr:hypothetical protein E3T53_00855 [Cryobacterium psychrophilum]
MGTTTVLVTPDQEEALSMADRVAVMRAGRVEQVGTPNEVYRRPATAFVSSFIGVVNRIPGRVTRSGQVAVLAQQYALGTVGHSAGDLVDLLVRPEHISIRPAHDGPSNATGVITALTLRGAISSLTVLFAQLSNPIRVDVPSRDAQLFGRGRLAPMTMGVPTISGPGRAGPGWSSILTGATHAEHHVFDNSFHVHTLGRNADLLSRAYFADQPVTSYVASGWPPLAPTGPHWPTRPDPAP